MALKGITEINNIINKFLEPFELTAELGTDFDYCFLEDKIHYALVIDEVSSNLFLKNAERRFPDVHADVFLWSLLHEVGHSETLDDLEDGVEEWCLVAKKTINGLSRKLSQEACNQVYFDLPDEEAATNWAGEYMMENSEEITMFWNKLQPALVEFYKLNEVA